MTSKTVAFPVLLLFFLAPVIGAESLYGVSSADNQRDHAVSAAGSTQQPATDVKGTWSGTFLSRHPNVAPFTMTVVINPDSRGHLIGTSSLNSDCLKDARLEVTVSGPKIVLAGSDTEGDNITLRGTIDTTGTLLELNYILNGSASGRCETDDGTGNMGKR